MRSESINVADEREKLRIALVKEAAEKGFGGRVIDAIEKYPGAQPVVIVDLSMSFWAMVVFMVKWVIASIPALLILMVLWVAFNMTIGTIFKFLVPR